MKASIENLPTSKNVPIRFPVLAQFRNTDVIVMFLGPTRGCILNGGGHYAVGVDESLSPPSNSENWRILPPETKVILQNT
jgi:hypothetical protein